MSGMSEALTGIMDNCEGLLGVLVIDSDGIPLSVAGDFDLPTEDLGAMLASCFRIYQSLGDGMGQFYVSSVTTEYDDVKVVQNMMPRGSLILVAEKAAPLGLIRMEAKRGIQALNRVMEETADERSRFMKANKFRKPQTKDSGNGQTIDFFSYLEKVGKKLA